MNERIVAIDDETLAHVRSEDLEPVLDGMAGLRRKTALGHHVARIPNILMEQWAHDAGLRFGSEEHLAYCLAKVQHDPDFSKFRIAR